MRLRHPTLAATLLVAMCALAGRAAEEPAGGPEAKSLEGREPPAEGKEGAGGEGQESTASDRVSCILYVRGGNVILGRPRVESLKIETRYGTLDVPLGEIVQVRFARGVPEEVRLRIEDAVRELGDEDFDRREKATEILRQIGPPARRFLKAALASPSDEAKARAGELLSKIAETGDGAEDSEGGMEPLRDADDDEVVTRRFTVRGRVLCDRLTMDSPYGDLEVVRDDIVGITVAGDTKISEKVTVAATSTVPDSWLDTKLSLTPGLKVSLEAKGQVLVSNYNLSAGPEGTTRVSGSTFGSFPMLSLVGKVGKSGKPFLVGKACRLKVPKAGTLYLGVVPFRRGYAASGSFEVRVESGR